EKPDKIKPAEQKNTPSEKEVVEEKQDTMPAWLDNSKTKTEKDNSKKAETETEEEKEDKFDLESYLSELEKDDSADQENEVNKEVNKNNGNKSNHNLRENESEIKGENREKNTENKTENKKETAAEAAQNKEEQDVYDLREGGNDIQKPGLKNHSQPGYPSNLRKRNIEGKVIITLRIDKEGKAHDLKINQSSGYDSFDQAALNAVSSWEFKAAEKDGEKVEVIVNLPVSFKLN
ncbi:MAG: energy transducer TonB, partial [Halanaerobium sp.]